jgi:metal-responsive CopG/Arc/MetJ family transcriptional regulator
VTVTLPVDLVARIDREARQGSRSGVIEKWLREAARRRVERSIEEATTAYYESLTAEDRAEDQSLARALGSAARRLEIDRG